MRFDDVIENNKTLMEHQYLAYRSNELEISALRAPAVSRIGIFHITRVDN